MPVIILYGTTPSSLIKAAMLNRVYNCDCVNRDEMSLRRRGILGSAEQVIDTGSLTLETVREIYQTKFGPINWLEGKKAKNLASAVYYASRYRVPDRYYLVITAIGQALSHGPDYVLSRVSNEARQMFNRSRRVCMEIGRAYGFVRLFPVTHGTACYMVGKVGFENDICDIVLRYFTRRYRENPVFLIEKNRAYYLQDRRVMSCDTGRLPFPLPENDFSELWEAYYDSQYIEGRKNLALAKKHLPKKYWSWVPEGDKLR